MASCTTIRQCRGNAGAVPALCLIGAAYRFIRHRRRGTPFPPVAQQAAGGAGFDPNMAGGFNPNAGADSAAGPAGDNVVDADYEVVDDDK